MVQGFVDLRVSACWSHKDAGEAGDETGRGEKSRTTAASGMGDGASRLAPGANRASQSIADGVVVGLCLSLALALIRLV